MDPDELAQRGIQLMLEGVRASLAHFRVHMDEFFSERQLHESGEIEAAIERLGGDVYEHDGALWLRTTAHGDDKDRVLRRSNGEWTYYASDIAYHVHKIGREYDRAIDVWGADHHGHITRMRIAWALLGGDPEAFELIIMQLVSLTEGGDRVKMSKRAGAIVTLEDLVDEIGVDAARWFLAARSPDSTLEIDLELARERVAGQPRLLRAVRARADRLDPAQGRRGARGAGARGGPARELGDVPSVGAGARQAAARAARRDPRGG